MSEKKVTVSGPPFRDASKYSKEVILAQLKKRNIWFPRHQKLPKLISIIKAADRGQLIYETFSIKHLAALMADRGIQYTELKGAKRHQRAKQDLAARLKEADKGRTFPRFFELPAELREIIYEYAMLDPWHETNFDPVQPPVTRVSRLVRQESLHVFYKRIPFGLRVRQAGRNPQEFPKWVSKIQPEHFNCITHLELDIAKVKKRHPNEEIKIHVESIRKRSLTAEDLERCGVMVPIGGLPFIKMFKGSNEKYNCCLTMIVTSEGEALDHSHESSSQEYQSGHRFIRWKLKWRVPSQR